MQANKHYYSEF